MEGADSARYDRLARFLDGLDRADPNTLEEPYRSLWFRIKDLDPKSVKVVPAQAGPIPIEQSDGSEFTIEESEPVQIATVGRERRIEVIPPSQVGPTFEMKVETKPKVTFKAAAENDVEAIRRKESAAKCLLQVQEALVPLKGVGGDAAVLFSMNKDMAKHYREGDYEEVVKVSASIISTLAGKEFRQGMMVYLQKKLKEYEDVGIEMGPARERFKQVAASYKEDRADFASLAGACNKLAEDAAKEVMGEPEEPEVIVAEIVKKGPVEPAPASVRRTLKKTEDPKGPAPPAPEPSPAEPRIEPAPAPIPSPIAATEPERAPAPAPAAAEPEKESAPIVSASGEPMLVPEPPKVEEDLKPLIKIVKKKLVALEDEGPSEKSPSSELSASLEPTPAPIPEERTPAPAEVKRVVPTTAPAEAPPEKKPVQEVRNTEAEELQAAYKRITAVYNAASKMHAAGRDVRQLFDLYNFAEEARKKGDNKIYIGVSKQLQSMLIGMQTKK